MAHEEYLRRNLAVCSCIGARASAQVSLDRLKKHVNPPKWLLDNLTGAMERAGNALPCLVEYRDAAPDAPGYVKRQTTEEQS